MADTVTKELKVRVYVDAQTGQLRVFESDMDKVDKAVARAGITLDRTKTKTESMFGAFLKSQIAMEAMTRGLDLAINSFKGGLVEIEEMEAAQRRLQATSEQTGINLKAMSDAAASIASDKLLEMDAAMQGIADLASKGFAADSLLKMGEALKDIAASAGGNTQQNFELLTKAIVTMRVTGEDVNRMLPTLKENLKAAGLSMAALSDPTKEAAAQQVILTTVMEQWQRVGDASTEKLKTLAGQTEALTTVTKDLKQAWAEGLMAGFKDTSGIDGANKTLSELEGVVRALATGISVGLVTAFKLLKAQVDLATAPIEGLIEVFSEIPGKLNEVAAALRVFGQNLTQVGTAIVDTIKSGIEQRWASFSEWFKGKLQSLRDMLPSSDAKVGPLSTLTAAGHAFWATFSAGLKSGEGLLFGAIMSGLQVLADALDGTAQAVVNAIGRIASAFVQGGGGITGLINAATQAAMEFASALVNLFKKDWEAEARKTTDAIYGFVGALRLSEDFMERFTEAAKASGDAVTTFQLMINEVIQDLGGINLQNAQQIFTLAKDLISAFEGGKVSAQEFTAAFGQAFTQLAAFAKEHGGVYMDQLKAMIAATERLGVAVPEVTAFLSAELDSLIGNVNKFAEEFSQLADRLADRDLPRIQQGWEKLGAFVGATIAEMIEQGRTWGEIMQQLGPSIETLIDTAERFGFKAKGAFGELLKVLKMMQEASDDFQRLDLMGDILDSLALFGRLGPKYIGDFFGQVKRTFADLLGFVGRDWAPKLEEFLNKPFEEWTKQQQTAFQSIIPYLLQAADYYREMGLPLPPMLQQLLDIAKAQGFISDTVPKPDPFEKIATELEKLNLNLENTLLMLQQMAGLVIPITFDVGIEGEGAGFLQKGPSSFKGLVGMHRITADSELMIGHRGEAIVDKSTADRIEGNSKGGNTYIFQGYSETTMRLMIQDLERDGY